MGLFYFILALYIAAVAYLGYLGYKHTKSSKDYMVAGGEMNPFLTGMAYGATFISTSAIVGFGGAAGFFGMSMLWLTFANIFFGIFIAFVVFGRRTRALGHQLAAYTFPQLLGARFESKFIRRWTAALMSIVLPLYAAAVMIGGARFLESALKMNYTTALLILSLVVLAYVYFGGLRGVIYTDAFQGSLMFVIMAILVILTYSKLGGVSAAHAKLDAMRTMVPAAFAKQGMTGFASMPLAFSQNWWFVMSTLVMGVGIGVLSQPQLIVRYLTVKSGRDLNRALVYGGVFILFMTGVAFTVGALSNAYFKESVGKISLAMTGTPPNTDKVIPAFISQAMPEWLMYFFLLALLAAAMSTLSGLFHLISTSVSYDLNPKSGQNDKRTLWLARAGLLVGFVVTVLVSFVLPVSIIAIATSIFFGLSAAAFLPMYVGALYWKRSSTAGATWSMVVGTVIYLYMVLFIHAKEAAIFGLAKALFGKATLSTGALTYVDPLIVALPASIVVFVVVSLLTKPSPVVLDTQKKAAV
ncbi:MAG: sodium:solute symporter family protein [Desulfitobacteriaceae bacterium]